MGNVVVVGSSNTDMVLNVPEIPAPGQTLSGNNFTVTGGGKGANQAVAVSKALAGGGDAYFIACVGDDDFGRQAVKSYVKTGMVTDYITTVESAASGVALIFVADSGENSIGINPGANACLSPSHIDAAQDAIEKSAVMLVQLESPIETVLYALRKAKELGVKTILNPAPAYELPVELFTFLDYITPNQTETEFYTGIFPDTPENAAAAAQKLHKMGVKNVIITMGSDGSFYSDSSGTCTVEARKVVAIDTVAAGDTFNGAFAVGIATGKSAAESLEFASTAAAIAVTRRGAQESAPSFEEIESFKL